MKDLQAIFSGEHGDFSTLFGDCELDNYVIRFFHDAGGENEFPYYKRIIGFTDLENGDFLLHLVDAEGCDDFDDLERSANRTGVEFRCLYDLLEAGGFHIFPSDQVDEFHNDDDGYWNEDEDDDLDIEELENGDIVVSGLEVHELFEDDAVFCLTRKGYARQDNFAKYFGNEDEAELDEWMEYDEEFQDGLLEALMDEDTITEYEIEFETEIETDWDEDDDDEDDEDDDACYDCEDCADVVGCRAAGTDEPADTISDERKEELTKVAEMLAANPLAAVFLNALVNIDDLTDGIIAGVIAGGGNELE